MRAVALAAVLGLVAGPLAARDPIRPAELPPPEFSGQQYVDSRGCLFIRAGTPEEVLWVPRVTREGKLICVQNSRPEAATKAETEASVGRTVAPDSSAAAAPSTPGAVEGGYFVAVGSFGQAENVNRAETRLQKLGYSVVRGRVAGASSTLVTVYAGPFADAGAAGTARDTLRTGGFPDAIVIAP